MTQIVDLDALRAAPVTREPFPYMIVPNFVREDAVASVNADYPDVKVSGSVPLPSLRYGPSFDQFMKEIRSPEMSSIIGEKFEIELQNRPTMITVRGQCRASDGQIHTDSKTKRITVLIYMNGQWEQPGGRLRLLRSPENLNDFFAEVPPIQGTLLAFRNQSNAWHGHEPFSGQRRAIQLNWVTNQGVVWREQWRHRLSAAVKKIF
jgi:hypothetical protein